jgi:hypothetical protein
MTVRYSGVPLDLTISLEIKNEAAIFRRLAVIPSSGETAYSVESDPWTTGFVFNILNEGSSPEQRQCRGKTIK